MKKKLFLAILLGAVFLICFTGCGKTADEDSPTAAADAFLKGIQARDNDAVNAVYAPGDFDINGALDSLQEDSVLLTGHEDIIELIQEKLADFDYKLSDEEIDGDTASVKVEFETYPFGPAANDFVTDFLPEALSMSMNNPDLEAMEELAESMLTEKLEGMDEKNYEKEATLSLEKADGVWKVSELEPDSEFYNAMTGGLIQAMEDINDMFESYMSGGY